MPTSSGDAKDVMECYCVGANTYMARPISYEQFAANFIQAVRFWTDINLVPE